MDPHRADHEIWRYDDAVVNRIVAEYSSLAVDQRIAVSNFLPFGGRFKSVNFQLRTGDILGE